MKAAITTYAIALAFLCAPIAAQAAHTAIAPEKMQAGEIDPGGDIAVIEVNGLVCDFCARAIEKIFMKNAAVAAIDVNLTSKKITISFRKGQKLDDKTVTDMITDAGYNVRTVTWHTAEGHGQ